MPLKEEIGEETRVDIIPVVDILLLSIRLKEDTRLKQ